MAVCVCVCVCVNGLQLYSVVDGIARDIADAVSDVVQRPEPNPGCSPSGCLRW